jgi:hypothetical protein
MGEPSPARTAGEQITVRVRRGAEELDLRLILAVPEDVGPFPQPETAPADEEPDQAPPEAHDEDDADEEEDETHDIPLPFPPPPGRQ